MSKEKLKERIDQITSLAMSFCSAKLDEEYAEIINKVIGKLSRKRTNPLGTGKVEIWAAAIIHAVGYVNFLNDKSSQPYVSFDELNDYFGTKNSTVTNKASEIRKMLKMDRLSSFDYMTKRVRDRHPLYNMVMINGFLVPLSALPEHQQQMIREMRSKEGKE